MESIGSSLPAVPEPTSVPGMKPLPDTGRTGRADSISDPAALLDPACPLQDGTLQKTTSHLNNNNNHQRLKDLTSRVLNGDQNKLPKLCSPPDMPGLKGADAPPTTASLQRKAPPPHADPGLKGQINTLAAEVTLSGSDEAKKRRGRAFKTKPPSKPFTLTSTTPPTKSLTNPTTKSTSTPPVKSTPTPPAKSTTTPLPSTTPPLPSTTYPLPITTTPLPINPLLPVTTCPHVAGSEERASPCIPPGSPQQEVNDGEEETASLQQEVEAVKEHSSPAVSFSVGDVVWTKATGYPWWPCMVSTDPELQNHAKPRAVRGPPVLLYHVQYFGDCPERGYILERSMVAFRGEEQYENLQEARKQPASRIAHKKANASVPRKFRAQWSEGVSQAREALSLPLDQRMDKFSYVYDQDGLHLNPHVVLKLPRPQLVEQPSPEQTHGAASRLLPPAPGPPAPPQAPYRPAKGRRGAASAEKKAVKDKRAGGGAQGGPRKPKQSAPSRADQNVTPKSPAQEAAAGPEEQSKLGPPRLKKKAEHNNRTKLASATRHKPAVLKKPSKKPPATQTSVSAKRKTSAKYSRENADEQVDRQPGTKLQAGRQTHKLKGAKPAPAPQKQRKRRAAEDQAQPAKRKRKGSVSGPADDQLPERQRRGKRKQEVDHQATPTKAKKRRSSPCPESEGSGSEERPYSPSDGLDDTKKTERLSVSRKEWVCQVCEQLGEDLLSCEGPCSGMFHLACLGLAVRSEDKLLCQECTTGVHPCFTCKQPEGPAGLLRCNLPNCGKFYHEACARLSPLSVFDQRGLRCPLHTCLSCHLGGRHGKATKGKMTRCLRCPVAYHAGEQCVCAGSLALSSSALLCTAHFSAQKGYSHHTHVNVSWCFVCSKGGQLLCCESCPAAFHPDCLNISMPEGSWFCNDCRLGKKPKYQDVIWVKLGTYRWWPAEIRHPRTVPTNIQHLRHNIGEFPVCFFGSKDFFWTHQGRVFPYMEGDRGSRHQKTNIGKVFKNALLEAEARFKEIKLKREAKEAQENNRKPPPYKFIKVNKPCGKVQVSTADVSEIPKCNCKPADERPCGFESECLNRMLLYECHPQVCPSGARCCNQDFTKRLYPDTKITKTAGKGWGLVCLRDIKKGEFVNEYVGELIDEEECRARIRYAQENNISHFYMLTIDKDRIIDAGPKGNYSRFMNHSCQPNCETQKWTVNGDTRVGLFAVCDIPEGTELTFNYNLDCLGNEKTVCRCEAPNCSGFLGDRPKTSSAAPSEMKMKRVKRRKRKSEGKRSEDECFRCGDGGQLVICGKKSCTKAYHLGCLGLAKRPFGRWDCPWHHCDVCGKSSEAFCQLCPNSFCASHQEGALREHASSSQRLCCLEHDIQDLPLG